MKPFLKWCPIVALAVSCVGTDVGNPPDDRRRVTGTLEFTTYDDGDESTDGSDSSETGTNSGANSGTNAQPDGVQPSGLVTDGGTDVGAVWFSIQSVVVTPADDCTEDAEQTIAGPWTVDLLGGTVYPEPPVLTEEPAEYCAIRLELAPARELPEAAPVEFQGQALWLEGTTAEGARLTVAAQGERVLNYDGKQFLIDGEDGAEVRFFTAFDPDGWFQEIDVTPTMPDIPVELNDGADREALAAFWSAFASGSRVVRDENADGNVDMSEFSAPVAVPF